MSDSNLWIVFKVKKTKTYARIMFHGVVGCPLELAKLTDAGWTGLRVGKDWVAGTTIDLLPTDIPKDDSESHKSPVELYL